MGALSLCPPSRNPAPPPPQLLPRPPNRICLPVGGHSLLRTADFGPQTAGAAGGGRAAAQSSSPAAPLRVRGGGAPGFPLGLRGGRGIPRAAAGRGAGARRAPGWAGRRGDLLSSRGTHRRSGSPGFMRPGARRPAAQDDIKSPPPPAAPPRGQGRGRGGAASGPAGPLGDVVPAPLKGGAGRRAAPRASGTRPKRSGDGVRAVLSARVPKGDCRAGGGLGAGAGSED